ncbi:MAG: DPP IV N-terminal domain-containing protein [bacterium]
MKFTVEGKEFILRLDTYTITLVPALSEEQKSRLAPLVPRTGEHLHQVLSPDRRWFAVVNRDQGVFLRSTYDGRVEPLITDGVKDYEWDYEAGEDARIWSPDSFKLALKKMDFRKVSKIPIVHYLKSTVEVEWYRWRRVGTPFHRTELFIVDILSKRQVRVDTGKEPGQRIYILSWRPDGSELLFLRGDRLSKKLDLMAANPTSGATRIILTETQDTFISGTWIRPPGFTLLEDGKRFIWMSEKDGWYHLYLYNLDGTLLRRLTEGAFPVLRVVAVDEETGWVYFIAHGDQRRPYDTHLYRVNLEGNGFQRLTEAPGQHAVAIYRYTGGRRRLPEGIQFAPSKEFLLDTHSSPSRPPVVELRRADGTLLQTLSRANIDALNNLKWSPPEEFVVKAADGKTDLYGLLFKPYDFDPNKKYPVIEYIYAGPQVNLWLWTFTIDAQPATANIAPALAQLGFIVFGLDARGTPQRGKEFQDVVYGNFGRYEIPDHVAALKQLAEKHPYMDLNRVGIYGYSWGGYFTIRALLFAPDVYHVGVAGGLVVDASAGGHERYLGLPQKNREGYEYASNLRLARNLKGKLLIIHGTSDINAPFSETMKMVEALIRAGKPYDLIVMPEQSHGSLRVGTSGTYWREAVRRYFQEHLKP